jgi:leucyl aminopeptidase
LAQVFSNDPLLARALQDVSERPEVRDPLWAQPLAQGYRHELDSPIADLRNIGAGKKWPFF